MTNEIFFVPDSQAIIDQISTQFDKIADNLQYWKKKNSYYHKQLHSLYVAMIPKGKNVLEIGSGDGELLNKLSPSFGVGLEISDKMLEIARKQYPRFNFIKSSVESYRTQEKFDYVVISNLLEYIFNLSDFFDALHKNISFETKLVITGINPLWEPVMRLATKLRLRTPVQMKNFVTLRDIENILDISGYEVIESGFRLLLPVHIPLISHFLNKLVARLPLLKNLCLIHYIVARPKQKFEIDMKTSCSVIIPCHNEEENVRECIARVPKLGDFMEILVVDDGSTDKTAQIVREIQRENKKVKLISYMLNKGKGKAVTIGFNDACGEILMILDADMAVLPEELTKFYNVLASRQAEFVNGSRMVYDMMPGAMKFLNYLGNKIFGTIITFIIGQRNTDTLCGTKAFYKRDYINFSMGKCPWGDFDLLFEAARLKLKTVELPVRYYPRQKGSSKMKAFKHGAMLLKMCWYGFWYLG